MELSEDEFEDGAESKQNPLAMTMYHQPSTEAAYEKVPTLLIDPGTLLSNVVNSGSVTYAPKVVSSDAASTSAPNSLVLVFTLVFGKQPLILQMVTYLVTRRIDQIDPRT